MTNTPTYLPGYSYTNTSTIGTVPTSNYAGALYNQAWYLTDSGNYNGGYDATTELQVADGVFITPNTTSNGEIIGYKNYNNYFGNTAVSPTSLINYTTISGGYRYATFVWTLGAGQYTGGTVTFRLNNVRNIVQQSANPACAVTSAGNPLYILYRLEDTANIYPSLSAGFYAFNTNTYTTVWLNANQNDPTLVVGNTNYYQLLTNNYPYSAYVRGGFIGTSASGGNFSIQAALPTPIVTTNTIYLYCRIGLPMGDDADFGYVTASL